MLMETKEIDEKNTHTMYNVQATRVNACAAPPNPNGGNDPVCCGVFQGLVHASLQMRAGIEQWQQVKDSQRSNYKIEIQNSR